MTATVRVYQSDEGGWQAWAWLEDEHFAAPVGFVIGTGHTQEAARMDAVATLDRAADQLRRPPTREHLLALCDLIDSSLAGGA